VTTLLLVLLILASSVWIGGAACLIVVSRVSRTALSAADRVTLFRQLGRRWGIIGTAALVVAYACGLILLLTAPWTPLSTWLVVLGVTLAIALAAGIVQARRMTRLRRAAASAGLAAPRSHSATILRAGIVALSVAMVVLAVVRTVR
jgi:1,4-dihydroxy-2-naphthoate octaprenyltransferase